MEYDSSQSSMVTETINVGNTSEADSGGPMYSAAPPIRKTHGAHTLRRKVTYTITIVSLGRANGRR